MSEEIVSALGERAAISGYVAQYDFFAIKAYDALIHNELVEIQVANNDNGILDDVYVETRDVIFACQMKHTLLEESRFSYKMFKELIPDIVRSWKVISERKNKKVIPCLISNKSMSVSDSIKVADKKIGSFSDFVHNVLDRLSANHPVEQSWRGVESELKEAILAPKGGDIKSEDLSLFFSNFKCKFACEDAISSLQGKEGKKEDLLKMRNLILDTVASNDRVTTLSKEKIIAKLQWKLSFETFFEQELSLNKKEFVPITEIFDELEKKIIGKESGYIFLEGSPGSGKSSFLTDWRSKTQFENYFFYAFDFSNPTAEKNGSERGEAIAMLHDFIVQLRQNREGIDHVDARTPSDIISLKKDFYRHIEQLHQRYIDTGRKTVFVVDGLDHIPREYRRCEQTLIAELPSPASLSDGVIVILGSQTYSELADLREDIKNEYANTENVIQMSPLGEAETRVLLNMRFPMRQIGDTDVQRIYRISQGHPLYTKYVLNALAHNSSIDAVLSSLPAYNNDIKAYYGCLIKNDTLDALGSVLGKIARIQDRIKLTFIKEWNLSQEQKRLMRQKVWPLLDVDAELRTFSFFHNSFRQFLLERTGQDAFLEEFDDVQDREYYSQLADLYKSSNVEMRIKCAKYLFWANRWDELLEESTPERLWVALKNNCPPIEIEKISMLGIRIAAEKKDLQILFRYVLMLNQLTIMEYNSTSMEFVYPDYYELDQHDSLIEFCRNNAEAQCNVGRSLAWSVNLYKQGKVRLAKKIFKLACPYSLINGAFVKNDKGFLYESRQLFLEIRAFLTSASCFYSVEHIRKHYPALAASVMSTSSPISKRYSEPKLNSLFELYLGQGLAERNEWSALDVICEGDMLLEDDKSALMMCKLEAMIGCANIDKEVIITCYEELRDRLKETGNTKLLIQYLNIGARLGVLSKNYSQEVLKNINLDYFSPIYNLQIYENIYPYYDLLFDYLCLRYYSVGEDAMLLDFSINCREEHGGNIFVKEMVQKLNIWAHFCSVSASDVSGTVEFRVKKVCSDCLGMFSVGNPVNQDIDGYVVTRYKKEYVQTLLRGAHSVGENFYLACSEVVLESIETEKLLLTESLAVEVLCCCYEYGTAKSDIMRALRVVETNALRDNSVDERVATCGKLGHLYHILGEKSSALMWYSRMQEATFGFAYRKDYQLRVYLDWVDAVNSIDKPSAFNRLKWVSQRIDYINNTTEGGYYEPLLLLDSASKVNLACGISMLEWLWQKGHISFISGLGIALRHVMARISDEKAFLLAIDIFNEIYLYSVPDGEINECFDLLAMIQDRAGAILEERAAACIFENIEQAIKTKVNSSLRKKLLKKLHNEDEEVVKSSEHVEHTPTDIELGIALAEQLLSEGRKSEARTCIIEAIEKSTYSSWHKYWDGALKLKAFTVLKRIDEASAYDNAFKTYAADVCAYPRNMWLECMLPFAQFFDGQYNLLSLFKEVELYMNREIRDMDVRLEESPDFDESELDECAALYRVMRLIEELNVEYFNEVMPLIIARDCQRRGEVYGAAAGLLVLKPHLCIKVAGVLKLISAELYADVINLLSVENFKHNSLTTDEMIQLGFYMLEVMRVGYPSPELDSYSANKETNIEATSVALAYFQSILDRIAYFSKTSRGILQGELHKIIESQASTTAWWGIGKTEVMRKLETIGARFSYISPEFVRAWNAIVQLIENLLKNGRLSKKSLFEIFPNYNYSASLRADLMRPDFTKVDYTYPTSFPKDAFVDSYLNREIQLYDGMHVIAEHTRVYWRGVRFDYEHRSLFLKDDELAGCEEYLPTSILQNLLRSIPLIFSRALAADLDWIEQNDECTMWKNKKGDICVKSVYWRDGNCEQYSSDNCETAEGWLLLITNEALNEIYEHFGSHELLQAKRFVVGRGNLQLGWIIEDRDGKHISVIAPEKLR